MTGIGKQNEVQIVQIAFDAKRTHVTDFGCHLADPFFRYLLLKSLPSNADEGIYAVYAVVIHYCIDCVKVASHVSEITNLFSEMAKRLSRFVSWELIRTVAKKVNSRDREQYGVALDVCPTLALKRTSRAITKFYDEMLRDAGISSGQLAMMLTIARDGSTTYARLSRELLIDATAVGRAVKALQARGLLSADEIEGSLRKKIVITEAGIECLRKAVPLWKAATDRFFESVDKGSWQRMRKELSHVSDIRD